MTIKSLLSLVLMLIAVTQSASAQICLGACKTEKDRVIEQNYRRTPRYSRTGAEFILDETVPSLGIAFRDPSGLIWSTPKMYSRTQPEVMKQAEAAAYCKSVGAELPTVQQFRQLAKYLGHGNYRGPLDKGYSPYLAKPDNSIEVLRGLSQNTFWSTIIRNEDVHDPSLWNSTFTGGDRVGQSFAFSGNAGVVFAENPTLPLYSAICVVSNSQP